MRYRPEKSASAQQLSYMGSEFIIEKLHPAAMTPPLRIHNSPRLPDHIKSQKKSIKIILKTIYTKNNVLMNFHVERWSKQIFTQIICFT